MKVDWTLFFYVLAVFFCTCQGKGEWTTEVKCSGNTLQCSPTYTLQLGYFDDCLCLNATAACQNQTNFCMDSNNSCDRLNCSGISSTNYINDYPSVCVENQTKCETTERNNCSASPDGCSINAVYKKVYDSACNITCKKNASDVVNKSPCTGSCYDGLEITTVHCGGVNCTMKVYRRCYNATSCRGIYKTTNGSCSKSCGSGVRNVTSECLLDGKASYICKESNGTTHRNWTESCNIHSCPAWSNWMYTSCSKSCDGGNLTKTRTCFYMGETVYNMQCQGNDSESEVCNTQKCPTWSSWSSTSSCSKTCDSGQQLYTRNCIYLGAVVNISNCKGNNNKQEICNNQACPAWTPWAETTSCSQTCNTGVKSYNRQCFYQNSVSDLCLGNKTKQQNCQLKVCISVWETWTQWRQCSATFEKQNGVLKRTRKCFSGNLAGNCTGPSSEEKKCTWCELELGKCQGSSPCDQWSSWSIDSCGSGKVMRRHCVTHWKPNLLNFYCENHDFVKAIETINVLGIFIALLVINLLSIMLIVWARITGYVIIELNWQKNKSLVVTSNKDESDQGNSMSQKKEVSTNLKEIYVQSVGPLSTNLDSSISNHPSESPQKSGYVNVHFKTESLTEKQAPVPLGPIEVKNIKDVESEPGYIVPNMIISPGNNRLEDIGKNNDVENPYEPFSIQSAYESYVPNKPGEQPPTMPNPGQNKMTMNQSNNDTEKDTKDNSGRSLMQQLQGSIDAKQTTGQDANYESFSVVSQNVNDSSRKADVKKVSKTPLMPNTKKPLMPKEKYGKV